MDWIYETFDENKQRRNIHLTPFPFYLDIHKYYRPPKCNATRYLLLHRFLLT